MQPLERSDEHHLQSAQGWLELGNALEARRELDQITPQFREHPDVLQVQWHICAQAKEWNTCIAIAENIMKFDPDRPDTWIHRSFALHELKRTREAFEQLQPVADRFPEVWTIPYNLACYCAQLGRLEESQKWLQRAMSIDQKSVKQAAIDDPDLKPLWEGTGGGRRRGV